MALTPRIASTTLAISIAAAFFAPTLSQAKTADGRTALALPLEPSPTFPTPFPDSKDGVKEAMSPTAALAQAVPPLVPIIGVTAPLTAYYPGPLHPNPIPPLTRKLIRSPWIGSQGRSRNTSVAPSLIGNVQLAASNTIGPPGGGEVYLYLY